MSRGQVTVLLCCWLLVPVSGGPLAQERHAVRPGMETEWAGLLAGVPEGWSVTGIQAGPHAVKYSLQRRQGESVVFSLLHPDAGGEVCSPQFNCMLTVDGWEGEASLLRQALCSQVAAAAAVTEPWLPLGSSDGDRRGAAAEPPDGPTVAGVAASAGPGESPSLPAVEAVTGPGGRHQAAGGLEFDLGPRPAPGLAGVGWATWGAAALLLLALAVTVGLGRRRRGSWRLFDSPPLPTPAPGELWSRAALLALAVLVLVVPAVVRYHFFAIRSYDFGIYAHSFWHASQGNGFFNTAEGMDHLGSHASPILYLLLPLYLLWPSPLTLLVANCTALALAVLPAYSLARARLGPRWAAGATALLVVNPFVANLAYDVHEAAFALPLLLAALAAAERRQGARLVFFLSLAMACKENVPLFGLLFAGWLLLGRLRRWLQPTAVDGAGGPFDGRTDGNGHVALVVALLSLLALVVGLGIIVPAFSTGVESSPWARLDLLGGRWWEVALAPLVRPAAFWGTLFSEQSGLYLLLLLVPFALVPLLGCVHLWLCLGDFVINSLSSHAPMRSGGFHYEAVLLPGLFLALAEGLRRLQLLPTVGRLAPLLALAGGAAASVYLHGQVGRQLLPEEPAAVRAEAQEVIAQVPGEVSLLAPHHLQPYLAQRAVARQYHRPPSLGYYLGPLAEEVAVLPTPANHDLGGSRPPPPGYVRLHATRNYEIWRRQGAVGGSP